MNQAEDVVVVLSHQHHYKFHSGTLARSSTLFAQLLTEPNAVQLNSKARNAGIKIRWIIELTSLPSERYPAGRFELVQLKPNGDRADNRSGLIVNENGRIPHAARFFTQYESILYAFYNKELVITDATMTAALEDCYELVEKAEYLGCTRVISKPIEIALLKHGQLLFRAVANAPQAWIAMAFQIRSEFLFRECFVHLVGNWRALCSHPGLRERLDGIPGLTALVERRHAEMLVRCRQLELGVVSWYPTAMLRPVDGDDEVPVKREAYAKDILFWLALTFFRQWITQRLVNDKGRSAADCGYALYAQLGAGADAYLDRGVMAQFHGMFPMTVRALRVVESHLGEIKEQIKGVVDKSGMLKSNSQLDVRRFPVPYLTCVVLEKDELPWGGCEPEPQEGKRKEYKPGGNEIALSNLNLAKRSREMRAVRVERREQGDAEFEREEDDEFKCEEDGESGQESRKRARVG